MAVTIYTDGGCRGNPGPSSAGVWVPTLNIRAGYYLGPSKTNNEAEYSALILAFVTAKEYGWDELALFCDSKLMVEQMKGCYAVKSETLRPLYERASELEANFKTTTYTHVKRALNAEADAICNKVLDDVEAGNAWGVYEPLRGGINT